MNNTNTLEEKLKNLKFKPDRMWVQDTEEKLRMLESPAKQSYNNFIFNRIIMSPKKILFLGGTALASLTIILTGLFLASTFLLNKGLTTDLSSEQKNAILLSIIRNNSTSLFGRNGSTNSLASLSTADSATAESKLASPLIFAPEDRNYTYRYSKVDYSQGNAASSCKMFDSYAFQPATTESYEYFSGNENYSKYRSFDDDGELIDYSLTTTTAQNSETVEYKGGNYAIRWSYTFSDDVLLREGALGTPEAISSETPAEPVSYGTSADSSDTSVAADLITQYFGEDADIVGSVSQNGKEYYVIQYSYKTNCSQDPYLPLYDVAVNENTELPDTIFVQNIVDPTSFEITTNRSYLGSVSDSNLLNSYTTTIVATNQSFSEVSSMFNFDYSVEIRDQIYPTYDPEGDANNLVSYLRGQDLSLLTLPASSLEYAYSSQAYELANQSSNYLADRAYYPAGNKGDEMFNQYNFVGDDYLISLLNLSYLLNSETYQYVNVDIYEGSDDLSSILGGGSSDTSEVEDITMVVDGVNVAAKLYTYTPDVSIYSKEEARDTSSDMLIAPENYQIRQIYVALNNLQYLINLPSDADFDYSTLEFSVVETQNSAEMGDLAEQIVNAYTKINASGVGVDSTTPESL